MRTIRIDQWLRRRILQVRLTWARTNLAATLSEYDRLPPDRRNRPDVQTMLDARTEWLHRYILDLERRLSP